jgi:ATP-dependent helicase/nuclease subunit B
MDERFEGLLPAEIVAALERGATVVTGNQRAARTIRQGVDRRNKARGLRSWQPARALAWEAWLGGWWSRLVMEGRVGEVVLNRSQELSVWRAVLDGDREAEGMGKESLAELAAEAWGLLCSYEGLETLRDAVASRDARAFQGWARAFERRCRAERWLTQAGLAGALGEVVAASGADGVGEILLVGFDALTPAQAGLVEALRGAGVLVGELRESATAGRRMLVEAEDEREELRVCAGWVKKVLEERPEARVAVVVPGLAGARAEIERVFREVLAPELEGISAGSAAGPVEFSVGVALSSMPMVAVAMDVLRWAVGALPLERVSELLLSPYFAEGRTERNARAEFDAFGLRKAWMLRPEVSLEELVGLVERWRGGKLARLLWVLRKVRGVVGRRFGRDEERSHVEWAEAVRELLGEAGWGAGDGEDSVEFQTRVKWESVLDEMSTLDFDGRVVRFDEALRAVERIAERTMFALESREAPVQVMGPLEAAGSRFDAVWFMRAGAMSWPMAVQSNPLLRWGTQKRLRMPGTDAARELEFARRVTERIAESAGTVVFSFAAQGSEDGGRQGRSAALSGLELEEVRADALALGGVVRDFVAVESVEDDVRLAALPDRVIRGGAALLAAQAACGFKAFAEQRLWSSEPKRLELGMDAAERGTMVHRVLERFWRAVKTQAELKAMGTDEREEMLEWAIREELPKEPEADAWERAYLDMERRRLQNLLGQWLELELLRPPFEVKVSEEVKNDVRVGPLRLRVIMDRVDVVKGADGAGEQEMILDYKTGKAEPKQWLTERPDAPQLPLYAALGKAESVAGVAFANVRLGEEMMLRGYAVRSELLTRADRLTEAGSVEEQIGVWRGVLTRLAEEFAAGDARVRPKQYPKTCKYCAQRLVCRLDVAAMETESEEESEYDGE